MARVAVKTASGEAFLAGRFFFEEGCQPAEPEQAVLEEGGDETNTRDKLDHQGGGGKVLTSKADDGVMARITGFIHLEKAGAYKFAFESNDGVRLKIDDKMIVEDPGVHDDQFSDLGTLEVAKPGWYPLSIDFFERRITWTLRFLWRPPGVEGDLTPVPAAALAH